MSKELCKKCHDRAIVKGKYCDICRRKSDEKIVKNLAIIGGLVITTKTILSKIIVKK